jgi:hypothetical protein
VLAVAALVVLAGRPAGAEELVRLVSPVPGSTFAAGGSLVVSWEPGPALAAFARAEEWEVFISLDGGRTFLARLTPHLDLDVRRVTLRLPPIPSDDVRLLLRMGDERVEREQLLPGRYRIVPSRTAPPWRLRSPSRGESARPGSPGVLHWVSGARDGSGWREHEVLPGVPACLPTVHPDLRRPTVALPAGEPTVAGPRRGQPVALLRRAPDLSGGPALPPTLAKLCRRNL